MVNHIDDSRERPETAVSDTIREKGGFNDDPTEPGHSKALSQAAEKVDQVQSQNPKQDDDDDDGINPSGYGGEC